MGNRLAGRVAVVTGAGRGIGRAEAIALAAEGAKVVVNDLGGGPGGQQDDASHGPADEVVSVIKDAGGDAVAVYDSVATMDGSERIIQTAVDSFGRLDILVNNAGILRDRMVFNMTEEEWDIVVAVHLKGHFACTKPAAQLFRQQRNGVIVNTSSESGLGNMGQANYAAAKEGIVGLTRTVARDMGRYGVRCNAVRPRAATRLTQNPELLKARERMEKEGLTGAPSGGGDGVADGLAQLDTSAPENVAATVAWLCTDEASEISGRTFLVGGGQFGLFTEPHVEATIFAPPAGFTVDYISSVAPQCYLGRMVNEIPKPAPQS